MGDTTVGPIKLAANYPAKAGDTKSAVIAQAQEPDLLAGQTPARKDQVQLTSLTHIAPVMVASVSGPQLKPKTFTGEAFSTASVNGRAAKSMTNFLAFMDQTEAEAKGSMNIALAMRNGNTDALLQDPVAV